MATYVLSADRFELLSQLPEDHPRPIGITWINRGTSQVLRPSSIEMLMRTFDRVGAVSQSAARLREHAGLQLSFRSMQDRHAFARLITRMERQGA